MTFANSNAFLLLLLLVPLAVVKIVADQLAVSRLKRVAGPRLLPQLRKRAWRGRDLLIFISEVLAFFCFVVALARPQWGYVEREVQGEGRSIIVAIDTSRSMLADDLTPDRLTRAKLAAQDLIAALPGDRIGLIAFAGRAFLQAPLTTDHEALIEALQQFDTELIPRGGSNLSEPIDLATEIFDKSGTASHALVMFSDGDELEGSALQSARKAKDHNVMVVSVGVGTVEGALLRDPDPRARGTFLKDDAGRPIRTKLSDGVLQTLARETGGLYLNLSGTSVLKERVQVILNKLDRSRTAAQKERRQGIDRYEWAVVPGLVALALSFLLKMGRALRPWAPRLTTAAALWLASGTVAHAQLVAPADWLKPSGWQLYHAGQYDKALERFGEALSGTRSRDRAATLEFGRGAAAFREKDWDSAVESFGQAMTSTGVRDQAEAAYNLGNALAAKAKNTPKSKKRPAIMADLVNQAIAHYEEALRLQPDHADAKANLEALKKFAQQLEEYRQQLRQKAKQKKQNGDKQEGQDQDGKDKQGDKGQQGEQGNDGKGQQGENGQPGGSGEEDEEDAEGGEEEGEQGQQPGQGPEKGQGQKPGEEGKDGGKGTGQNDREQAAPEGDDAKRAGEQGKEGQIKANDQGQAGKGKEGDQGKEGEGKKPGDEEGKGDQRRDRRTGFSRTEARALLKMLSDEDYVRPLTEKGAPEGTYKNW